MLLKVLWQLLLTQPSSFLSQQGTHYAKSTPHAISDALYASLKSTYLFGYCQLFFGVLDRSVRVVFCNSWTYYLSCLWPWKLDMENMGGEEFHKNDEITFEKNENHLHHRKPEWNKRRVGWCHVRDGTIHNWNLPAFHPLQTPSNDLNMVILTVNFC